MKIVIDISEEDYEYCKDRVKRVGDKLLSMVEGRVDTIVANGIPLPKGHGRLFDERDIINARDVIRVRDDYWLNWLNLDAIEPLIEADKEVEG